MSSGVKRVDCADLAPECGPSRNQTGPVAEPSRGAPATTAAPSTIGIVRKADCQSAQGPEVAQERGGEAAPGLRGRHRHARDRAGAGLEPDLDAAFASMSKVAAIAREGGGA